MSETILVASKDARISKSMDEAVRQLGLSLRYAESLEEFSKEATSSGDVLLFVIDLDSFSPAGTKIGFRIRTTRNTPLILVGSANDKGTVVRALKAGADYYLPKPLDTDLLAAYLEAALRRGRSGDNSSKEISVRDLTIDTSRKEIRLKGDLVPVTRAEYRLLSCLARNLGKVTSCSDLVMEIGGYSCSEQEAQQIVKVHVSRLRNKIDLDPTQPSYITNVRGFGYLLERRSSPRSPDSE
jgi:DNA-binding response OmpR family regulator